MKPVVPFCGPSFSPQRYWAHVPTRAVQETLRSIFACWGLPGALRVDNGKPWGSARDLPPVLALWLLGLGMQVLWNPPRQPQKNGVVERSQGTSKRWAEPDQCDDAEHLQSQLDDSDRLQREQYPYREGKSRLQVFPQLPHSGRVYRPRAEAQQWRLQPVLEHLASYAVRRRVDSSGTISVYDRNLYVGVIHRRKLVQVMFDPHQHEWLICNDRGEQLRSKAAPEIAAEPIRRLWSEQKPSKSSC
jgi:hypothetical protein